MERKITTRVMDTGHLNLLCSVNELSAIVAGSSDIRSLMDKLVDTICLHIQADVCSIYLYDDRGETLTLKSTRGLNKAQVDQVSLKLGEGLVGECLRMRRPICETKASSNPKFRHFDELDEDMFEAFLAVPIIRSLERIGVLVLQRHEEEPFNESDVLALQATASMLANVIENIRITLSLAGETVQPAQRLDRMELISGIVASPGIGLSTLEVLDRSEDDWQQVPGGEDRFIDLPDFEAAVSKTTRELELMEARLEADLPEMASMIFGAHVMMLKDPEFTGKMLPLVERGALAAEAVLTVARGYVDTLRKSKNVYIREKVDDVKDLARRLISNLFDADRDVSDGIESKVVMADILYPSDLLILSSYDTKGIILSTGGVTSHIAILARSMNIPMIISPDPRLKGVPSGTKVLLDASIGNIYVNPSKQVLSEFHNSENRKKTVRKAKVHGETSTACGETVCLLANVNLLRDADHAIAVKAEGVGLYRTEFPFLIRSDFPSESDQINIYHYLIEKMGSREITFRTLDVGADKALSYFHQAHLEENPVLGMRSIRFSHEYPDIFMEQLRAILRASCGHDQIRIMFPMISGIDEFVQAKNCVELAAEEMKRDGIPHQDRVQIGMMVEVPSVLPIINEFAELVDFFCIGTNDLIQLTLAVDRNNESVQKYFIPEHPAILRSIKATAEAGLRHGIPVSVCGEMAHDPRFVCFMLGVGIRKLSLDPQYLPDLQQFIGRMTIKDCEALAAKLLESPRISHLRQELDAFVKEFDVKTF